MEKKTIKINKSFYLNWTNGVSLEQIKEDIKAMERLGINYIDIRKVTEYGDTYIETDCYEERLETDEEYEKRIKSEEFEKEQRKQQDLLQLEFLKAKYGNQ